MLSYKDLMMHQERYQELQHEAETERLLQRASSQSAHHQALSWLGGQLVAWGHSLQRRYGTPARLISNHR